MYRIITCIDPEKRYQTFTSSKDKYENYNQATTITDYDELFDDDDGYPD